ncbi:hypothetical protein ACVBEF_00910 [Glaciimonas sp. GG7]
MTKTASHPHVSAAPEPTPPKQAPESTDQPHLSGLSEDDSYQLYEARCMLQLLEDLATQEAHREVIVSRQSLAVMMGVIREKLVFSTG